jgi:hypothetical protein
MWNCQKQKIRKKKAMSKKYKIVKNWYTSGIFDEDIVKKKMVRDAVEKGWITKEEYAEITGEKYFDGDSE